MLRPWDKENNWSIERIEFVTFHTPTRCSNDRATRRRMSSQLYLCQSIYFFFRWQKQREKEGTQCRVLTFCIVFCHWSTRISYSSFHIQQTRPQLLIYFKFSDNCSSQLLWATQAYQHIRSKKTLCNRPSGTRPSRFTFPYPVKIQSPQYPSNILILPSYFYSSPVTVRCDLKIPSVFLQTKKQTKYYFTIIRRRRSDYC